MKIIYLLAILSLGFLVAACGTGIKSGNNNIRFENPVQVAEVLMYEGKFAKSKEILLPYIDSKPLDWQPRSVQNSRQKIYYWDQLTLESCQKIDQEKQGIPVDAILGKSYSKAYFILGFIAVEMKDYILAHQYLDKGLLLEPEHPGLLAEKAAILLNQKDFQAKEAIYRKIVDSKNCMADPDRARAYRGLGVVLIDLHRLDEAEVVLYESLKYEGNHPLALNELNYIDTLRNGGKKQKLELTKPLKK